MTQPANFKRTLNKLALYASVGLLLMTDVVHAQASGLIPCDGADCSASSFIQLINTLVQFFFTTLLLPLFVVMILYLGYSYIAAQGKPGMHAKLGSMAKHMVGGLVLMLCAWLIVKTILVILGYNDPFGFFGQ